MLQLISTKPENMCLNIDYLFAQINVYKYVDIIEPLIKRCESVDIIASSSIEDGDKPESIPIRGKFGKTNLSKISTGLKAVILALIYKSCNKSFCCPEFCIGANIIPDLAEIAKDTDLISLWTPRLDLSMHYNLDHKIQVLADGEVKTICC